MQVKVVSSLFIVVVVFFLLYKNVRMIHTHSIILSQATHFQDEVAEYKIIADRGFQPKIHPKHVVLNIISREKKL